MSLTKVNLETLVDAAYEAALAPDRWKSVLIDVGQAIGATGATVFWVNGAGTTLLRAEGWNMDLDALALYEAYYIGICPRIRMSRHIGAGEIFDDLSARASPTATDREYYEFADAHGYDFARILLAEHTPDLRIGFNFYGPIREDTRAEEHRLLHALCPHLRRASRLTLRLGDFAEQAEFGETLFELSSPMLLLGEHGRVERMNARAGAVLAKADGLLLAGGHLRAARAADEARLQREIGAALAAGRPRAAPMDGFALVSRPSGGPPWAVSALPLPPRLRHGLAHPPPRALVTIAETVPRVSPARLRRGFGLSQAEAEVAAALAQGHHLDEIAASRHASLETVRAQLKSVFAKLEVSTQAQLVSRVASLCGLPPPRPQA